MPITLADAPSTLPSQAKEIYVSAFNNAYSGTCKSEGDRRDECSARIAWTAVKSKYRKGEGDEWTPKAEVQQFSMAIVRASYDKATATRRWRATASDTEDDSYNDNMTLELFNDFLHRIETKELPPEDFRSDFWSGGKPYLSVSHYPDLDGKGVPGPVDAVFIDGRVEAGRGKLKATGRFDDTPIGRACFESVCDDLYGDDPIPDDEKIRISIAFLDWMHRHKSSDYVFERSEDNMICPECIKELLEGEYGGKEFLRGHLIHLGMTRVPVNTRTDMEVERSMTTRKEDAASIIGDELAEELEEETKMVGKSEALVIKAEDKEEPLVEEGKAKKDEMEYEEEEEEEEEGKKKKKKDEKKSEAEEPAFEAKMLSILEEIKAEVAPKEVEPHPLDGAIAELKSVYDVAVEMDDAQAALQAVQEPFEILVRSIQENIQDKPEEVPESDSPEASIAQMLAEFRNEIGQEIGLLRAEVAAKKAPVQKQEISQVPERRSISPELVLQPTEQESSTPKLREIVNKSVGL